LRFIHLSLLQLDEEDKKTVLAAIKDANDWIDANGQTASAEDLEEKLSEIQGVVNPITSKMYGGAGAGGESHTPGEDDEEFGRPHDEL